MIGTIRQHLRNMKMRYSHVRLEAMRCSPARMQKTLHSVPPLGNREVLEMLIGDFSADIVVAKIKAINGGHEAGEKQQPCRIP